MASAILKLEEREVPIGNGPVTFGRAAENTFPFPDNPNISRHHAEIAFRDGRYVVTDLGSSNGTTINGQPIEGETELNNGDFVTIGNSVIVEVLIEDDESDGDADDAGESVAEPVAAAEERNKSKSALVLGATGAVCGLAIVFAVVAGYVYLSGEETAACDATAQIISPVNGDLVRGETEVRINVRNAPCVRRVKLLLNGRELASLEGEPYSSPLDTRNFPELANGGLHALSVVIEDVEGKSIPQAGAVNLQFETREVKTPTPTPTPTGSQTPIIASGKQLTHIEAQTMSAAVVSKFTGASTRYNLANRQLLDEVRKYTAEYSASEGYYGRAAQYKETINQTFVRDKSLDASLPYLLAMSRSRFNPASTANGEGLWQMTNDFATANAYNVACINPSLSDASQECASKAAALYLEDLVVKTFDGDILLAVAAYGKTVQEANLWKATLPADRSNIWNVLGDQKNREQVARFLAAAIVAENPKRFGLKNDRPISEHYPPVGR